MSFFKDFVTVVGVLGMMKGKWGHSSTKISHRTAFIRKRKLERPRKSLYKQEEQIKSCGEKTRGTVVSFNQIRHEVSNDGPISIQRIISVLRLTRPQSSSRYPSHLAFPCRARRTI